MSAVTLALIPNTIDAPVILWPLVFGLGAVLVLTAQPVGRPKPDLAERLRRLDVDERIRAELTGAPRSSIFMARALEQMLRPVLDDVGRLVQAVLGSLGVGTAADLPRKLQIARPGVEPAQFFGEKVGCALISASVLPLMNVAGIHPFGPWPVWGAAVGLIAGYLAPDWQLEGRIAARRTRCLMELPTILDMLTIAASAGLALEQAIAVVARQSQGAVARELQHAIREMAFGQRSTVEALEAMAERNAVPELTNLVSQLRGAYEQGIPLSHALAAQAEALREQKRLRIVEEGGKASVRMILPVALFILPVLFVVLLVPAAIELMQLGS
jgi:tight adherence protein C